MSQIQNYKKQIKEWQVDKNKFIILLPGRLTNWKGQIVFIEALNILNQQTYVKPFSAIILGSDQGRNVYYKKLLSLVEKIQIKSKNKIYFFLQRNAISL